MNRTIKFRAWYKPKKEMVNLREFGASQAEASHIIFGCEEYGHQFYDSLNDADWELMQFTGLLDSEKVEVYEGDILQSTVDAGLFNWLVEWKDGGFVIVNIGVKGYLGDRYKISSQYYFTDRKVIGNIFETPELLKINEFADIKSKTTSLELGTKLKHKEGVLRAMKKLKIGFRVSRGTYQSEQAIIEVMCESKDGLEIYEQMLDIAWEAVGGGK